MVVSRLVTRRNPDEPILLYHGSRAWDGPPEVQRGRAKRTEHGPGIYLTTALTTAKKYAKGGGTVKRVTVSADLRWLSDAKLSLAEALAWAREQPRMRHRRELVADIERSAARRGLDVIDADTLVNLAVNNDSLVGDAAPALARFLVDHGIDAGLATQSSDSGGDEDWVVLSNARADRRGSDGRTIRSAIVRRTAPPLRRRLRRPGLRIYRHRPRRKRRRARGIRGEI